MIRTNLYRDHQIEVVEGVNYSEDIQVISRLVYYANRVEVLEDTVYYYNCCNMGSYSSLIKENEKMISQRQISCSIPRDFFKDKEKRFYDAASELATYGCWLSLHYAAKSGNRTLFEQWKQVINEEYSEYQCSLGWNNPLKKWFQQQFYLWGTFLRIRSFVFRFLRQR